MRYYSHLYVGGGIEKKKEKIVRRLETGKLQPGIHLITLPETERTQLEIFNSNLLLQPDFPKIDYFIVGIVKGYEEAVELVEEITKEVYNETKGADIRSYILKKEQEG